MEKTVVGAFQSWTQVNLMIDALKNEGITTDTLSVMSKRIKLENATSNLQAGSPEHQQVTSTGFFNINNLDSLQGIASELTNFGISQDQLSHFANKVMGGNIVAAIKVDDKISRTVSSHFRKAGARDVKTH